MDSQSGFTRFSIEEFETWIAGISVARTITTIQEHHTWRPNYSSFNGTNHFDLQRSMKNHHVSVNGWNDIGQNFTIFPDGIVMTGRSIEKTPACIFGNNPRCVCIENLGDFDSGRDDMRQAQANSIVRATAALAKRFGLSALNDKKIIYHHWFDLETGARTNGSGNTKSCPGTAFFGGNKVADFNQNFLPLVQAAINGGAPGPQPVDVEKYVCVSSPTLNVRTGPGTSFPTVAGVGALQVGTVLRIYEEDSGWYRISNSQQRWVKANRTFDVTKVTVNTDDTKCRIGPGVEFDIVTAFDAGEVLFVHEERDGWSKVDMEERWIRSTLLD